MTYDVCVCVCVCFLILENESYKNKCCSFVRDRCRALVRYLATAPECMAFRRPVDTTVFTDYHQYVDEPCDLRTIDRRLEAIE